MAVAINHPSAPMKQREIPESIGRLESAISALDTAIDELRGQLVPVSRMEPAPDGSKVGKEDPSSCELVGRINELADRVRRMTNDVRNQMQALEV